MANEQVAEVRSYVERAMGTIDTLDLGPVDYNVATAADYLRTAAALLEQYGRALASSPGDLDRRG